MVMQLTEVNRDDARDALSRAHGNVKIAVMVLNGCDLKSAKQMLGNSNDHLGIALQRLGDQRYQS